MNPNRETLTVTLGVMAGILVGGLLGYALGGKGDTATIPAPQQPPQVTTQAQNIITLPKGVYFKEFYHNGDFSTSPVIHPGNRYHGFYTHEGKCYVYVIDPE